jgi:hypothetical protein
MCDTRQAACIVWLCVVLVGSELEGLRHHDLILLLFTPLNVWRTTGCSCIYASRVRTVV